VTTKRQRGVIRINKEKGIDKLVPVHNTEVPERGSEGTAPPIPSFCINGGVYLAPSSGVFPLPPGKQIQVTLK
jgi:hypothetical protein